MPAHVVERVQLARPRADDQHALAGDLDVQVVPRGRDRLLSSDGEPLAMEDAFSLSIEVLRRTGTRPAEASASSRSSARPRGCLDRHSPSILTQGQSQSTDLLTLCNTASALEGSILSDLKSPRSRRTADKRDRIVECAMRHFAEDGYQGAKVEDVANDLGIAKGSIFQHFGSKAGLFFEAYKQAVTSLPAWLDAPQAVLDDGFFATLMYWLERTEHLSTRTSSRTALP